VSPVTQLALSAAYIGVVFYALWIGRRRGRREMLDTAGSMLAEARQEDVEEGANLIRAVSVQHRCDDTGCTLADQRRNASWQ
jgi:hypothetical protein